MLPGEDLAYFGKDGDRLQMMFNFHANQHLFLALATGTAEPLAKALEETRTTLQPRNGRCTCAITTNWTSAA